MTTIFKVIQKDTTANFTSGTITYKLMLEMEIEDDDEQNIFVMSDIDVGNTINVSDWLVSDNGQT